jgi:hypothetical protein
VPLVHQIDNGRLVEREEAREAAANTKAAKSMREQDDMDLREIIESFGADKAFELKVIRRKPKQHKGVDIDGHLDTFDEWVTEEELQQMFGGGTYTLKVYRPNAKGSMVYFKSATVKLPGPPKGKGIDSDDDDDDDDHRGGPHYFQSPASYDDPGVVSQAIGTLKDVIEHERNSKGSGMDPALLALLTGPLNTQLEQTQRALELMQGRMEDKDQRILELVTKQPEKPDTSASDRLMDKMFDSNNSRMEGMRAMHESEIRMMRENHRDDIKRIEDRYERQMHAMQEAHKREIDNLQRSTDMMTNASQIGYEGRLETHKMESERLRADLAEARAEVAALRAKKEKSMLEQAQELALFNEKMSSLGFGGLGRDEEDEPHWAEKLLGGIIENPEVISTVAQGISGAQQQYAPPAPPPGAVQPSQQPQQPQQAQPGAPQLPPQSQEEAPHMAVEDIEIGQPFRGADGEVYVKVPPDGEIVTYSQALAMARKEEAEAREAAAAAAAEEARKPTKQQVSMAVVFAENAYKNNVAPETFARTARNSVPGDLLDYIGEVGVDSFLNEVADLEPSSPLRTQAGRNYMREVAGFLLNS